MTFRFTTRCSIVLTLEDLRLPTTKAHSFAEERLCISNIDSVGGGRCHIIISISKTAIGWWTRQV
jgi:hypothetical protein